jgi:hypothetical protein
MVGAQYRKGGRDIATAVLPAQFEGANVKVPQFRALALGIKEADKRSSRHVADEAQVIARRKKRGVGQNLDILRLAEEADFHRRLG